VRAYAGYIYVITDDTAYDDGLACKIGRTQTDIKRRIKQLQTGHPRYLRLITAFRTKLPDVAENRLHTLFAKRRIHGEWFSLRPAELEELCFIAEDQNCRYWDEIQKKERATKRVEQRAEEMQA
jgi:hypothetical protein